MYFTAKPKEIEGSNPLSTAIQPISLVYEIAERFRQSVINGTLKPNEEINESQVAEQLNVSRGTTREAIRILVGEGLFEKLPNRKARVRVLPFSKFWEIMTARAAIEGTAASVLARRLTPDKLERLNSILGQMNDAASTNDNTLFSARDFEFHKAIMEMSGHELLLETWTKISTWIRLMFAMEDHTQIDMAFIAANHKKITDAIASGDPDVAEATLKSDIINQPEWKRFTESQATSSTGSILE
jgi:DNA-binding GntR family transcriptional regulator